MSITPILEEFFYHEGRGPELQKVHYAGTGTILKAVDYFNPDDEDTHENMKHLLFLRSQVFMFTPEEVYGYSSDDIRGKYNNAAIIWLGKSKWLQTFSQRHLENCFHYKLMFYDEFLDVICEEIEAKNDAFAS